LRYHYLFLGFWILEVLPLYQYDFAHLVDATMGTNFEECINYSNKSYRPTMDALVSLSTTAFPICILIFNREQIMEPAPVLKFSYLIILPTSLWVVSTIVANPTHVYNITFGQVIDFPD
jgi:hypothetical protein